MNLPASSLVFTPPTVHRKPTASASAGVELSSGANTAAFNTFVYEEQQAQAQTSDSSSLLLVVAVVLCVSIACVAYQRSKHALPAAAMTEVGAPDAYARKVASLDAAEHGFEEE